MWNKFPMVDPYMRRGDDWEEAKNLILDIYHIIDTIKFDII